MILLIWYFTTLDIIWQTRNEVVWRGVKPNPWDVVQRIKVVVNYYILALSSNSHLHLTRGMQNREIELRPVQIISRFSDCLILGWRRSKYKVWLAAVWFKQGVAYRWTGKSLNAQASISLPLLVFIRDLFIDFFDLTIDLCVGIPSKLVVNILGNGVGSAEEKRVRDDIVGLIGHGRVTWSFCVGNDYLRDVWGDAFRYVY